MDPYATSSTATLTPDIDDDTKVALAAAIRELGVTEQTLTAAQKISLDRDGYVVIANAITPEQATHLAGRLEAIAAEEGENAGKDFHTEPGTTRLGCLLNKDPDFDICFLHPTALACISHVMQGSFGLSSITGRAALPGEGHQALHRDFGDHLSANALWVLSDFTQDNGPTRLIPGSHRWIVEQFPQDNLAPHPQQIRIIAPAGSLVVIDGRTLHGGTKNNTEKNRHLVSAFFTPRHTYQKIDRTLFPTAAERLDEAARFVLDFDEPH